MSDGIDLNDLAWHGMATIPFFFNTSFGVFCGIAFGLYMVLGGKSAFSCQKVPWKVPPRLHQGSTKWLLLQKMKRFCGGFPQLSTFVSQMAVASYKVLWRVPPTALYIYLPVLLGPKLRELLTCLNHNHTKYKSSPQKRPIMLLLLGYSLGFFLHHMATQWCSSQCMSIHVVPILFLTKMRDRLNIF